MHSTSKKTPVPLVFWQPSLSPHQTPLLEQLAKDWPAPVYLIVDRELAINREKSYGWQVETPDGIILDTKGPQAPADAIHIISGFYGTKSWRKNFRRIARNDAASIWVMAESLETWDHPLKTILRFLRHGGSRLQIAGKLSGFLAIGEKAENQAKFFRVPSNKTHPFCYVTSPPNFVGRRTNREGQRSTILFLGGILKRKGVDVLFESSVPKNSKLQIIGAHVEKDIDIPHEAEHLGVIPNSEISNHIREADVLVLPSRHDGWGAVINEALMVGTPVVCTSACGGSVLLGDDSPFRGEVVYKLTPGNLSQAIEKVLDQEIDHDLIVEWSIRSISPASVSHYLTELLSGRNSPAPWIAK